MYSSTSLVPVLAFMRICGAAAAGHCAAGSDRCAEALEADTSSLLALNLRKDRQTGEEAFSPTLDSERADGSTGAHVPMAATQTNETAVWCNLNCAAVVTGSAVACVGTVGMACAAALSGSLATCAGCPDTLCLYPALGAVWLACQSNVIGDDNFRNSDVCKFCHEFYR